MRVKMESNGELFAHGDDTLGPVEKQQIPWQSNDYQLLKMDPTFCSYFISQLLQEIFWIHRNAYTLFHASF
jgi:hypothetical protein